MALRRAMLEYFRDLFTDTCLEVPRTAARPETKKYKSFVFSHGRRLAFSGLV